MPMTLWFKRAKSFVTQEAEGGTKQFLAQPGNTPQSNVPFWVADTPTFKFGVKDGSIVNLTPPDQMPGYKPATVVVVTNDPETAKAAVEAAAVVTDEEESADRLEIPQAPFGGQPMTPVAPAVKLGIQHSGRKK